MLVSQTDVPQAKGQGHRLIKGQNTKLTNINFIVKNKVTSSYIS